MTLLEFISWFEGYAEHIGETPTPEQWARIKAKVEAAEVQAPREGERATWGVLGNPWRHGYGVADPYDPNVIPLSQQTHTMVVS